MNALTVTEPLSLVLGRMNEIQEAERATIALMPGMSNDELLHVLEYADAMGNAAWRIKCAAHSEVKNRCEKHGDKAALIESVAKQDRCTPKTIYLNAQIHELAELAPDIEDKQVFIEVLSLPKEDRASTVKMIADKLHANVNYGMKDVKADVHGRKNGETTEQGETTTSLSLRLSQASMQQLTALCSAKRLSPSEWATQALWLYHERPVSDYCVPISEEQLAWLAQKAAKRVETYGPDDEKGTPEGYLEFILAYRMREDERNAKRNR